MALLFGGLGLAGIEMAWKISAASPGDPNIQQIVGGAAALDHIAVQVRRDLNTFVNDF